MSSVSIDGALASLQKENPAWDFDAVHQSTRDQWQALLSRAQVTGTTDEKTSFYTSMYHLMMQPNNIADIDGRYQMSYQKRWVVIVFLLITILVL